MPSFQTDPNCTLPQSVISTGTMEEYDNSDHVKQLLCACLMLAALPLTIATAYYLAGPNPRDQFELSLLTTRIDLDGPSLPTVRFRLYNKSGHTVLLKQFDADFGCRIVLRPNLDDAEILHDNACEVESTLKIEHEFVLPRTRSQNVVPVSVLPIVSDAEGNSFALPSFFFEQEFYNRVTASSDLIRLASFPNRTDAISSVRSIVLNRVGSVAIDSIRLRDEVLPGNITLSIQVEQLSDASRAVTVAVSSKDADANTTPKNLHSELIIQTSISGVSESKSDVRIPIVIQPTWAL